MPLCFDMNFEALQSYAGRNPKPSDFDDYWKRGINEVMAIEPAVELIPAKFSANFADCFDLYFTGTKRARIHAKFLRPKNIKGKCPAVLMFHGYSADSGDWLDKLPYVAAGFCVAAMDCRGQGGLSEDVGGVKGNTFGGHIIRGLDDSPDKLLFRDIFLDTFQLARVLSEMPEIDKNKLAATGGSQGGALTVACAALVPWLNRAAPVFPFLSDYKRVWEMDLAKDAYNELKEYFRKFDPLHEKEDEVFSRLGYIDIQHFAPRINCEILWGIGLMDTICPPSTQFAVYNKIKSKKNLCVYKDFGHEWLPGMNDKIFSFMCEML
ncbi:MAG: alpha/beta fold hydrolase [Candidatus Nanoarchaeia archaeon]